MVAHRPSGGSAPSPSAAGGHSGQSFSPASIVPIFLLGTRKLLSPPPNLLPHRRLSFSSILSPPRVSFRHRRRDPVARNARDDATQIDRRRDYRRPMSNGRRRSCHSSSSGAPSDSSTLERIEPVCPSASARDRGPLLRRMPSRSPARAACRPSSAGSSRRDRSERSGEVSAVPRYPVRTSLGTRPRSTRCTSPAAPSKRSRGTSRGEETPWTIPRRRPSGPI